MTRPVLRGIEEQSPFRDPAWRWTGAHKIIEGRAKPTQYKVQAIDVAVAYLRSKAEPTRRRRPRCLSAPVREAISQAHQLYETDGLPRYELEARLLAGQTDEEIAGHCSLPALTVHWYEQLFCHVRDCLGSTDYLLATFVGPGRWSGFRDDRLRQFWAWTALAGGPLVLEALVDAYRIVACPTGPPTLQAYLAPDNGLSPSLQAYVAMAVLPTNQVMAPVYWELHLELQIATPSGQELRDDSEIRSVSERLVGYARDFLAGKAPRRPISPPKAPENTPTVRSPVPNVHGELLRTLANMASHAHRERQTAEAGVTAVPKNLDFSAIGPGSLPKRGTTEGAA